MRVCYLTNGFPFPLTSGYLRHFHLIREIADEHEVTLLSLAGRSYRPEHAAALAPYTSRVIAFPTRTGGTLRAFRRRLLVEPEVRRMARTAARLHAASPFDVVVVSGKTTAPVLDALPGVPVVADLCDATSLRLRGQIEHSAALRRAVLRWDAWRVGRVETRLARTAARLVLASARDRDALLGPAAAGDPRVVIIANGIDLEYWDRHDAPLGRDRIVLTGAMHYPPNEDAALVLIERILPRVMARVPQAEVVIVGRDPTPSLVRAGRTAGVTVTGYVDDVRPYLASAAVAAAPLRFGAGIQNKVLEAMAFEVPVVASTIAAGGLRVEGADEPPIDIADDADTMADRLVDRLLAARRDGTPDRAGRAYVAEHFSWSRAGERLSALIGEAASSGSRRRATPQPAAASARARQPGFSVALIGPDGAGKTTIARRLPGLLARPTSYVYMGVAVESSSDLLPTTRLAEHVRRRRPARSSVADDARRRPRGRAQRSVRAVVAALKLVNRLAEEWYRQGIVWRDVRRGRVVVLDRHFFVDYHAADIVAEGRTVRRRVHGWVLAHLYPRPDLTIFLDAPAEVLLARKGEGTLESLERRRADYLTVGRLMPRFEIVDATRPLEAVVDEVVGRIQAFADGEADVPLPDGR